MSILPRVSGREVVKALTKVGYERDRQRGSHISFDKKNILIAVLLCPITKKWQKVL